MYSYAITPHFSFALKPLVAAVLVVCAAGLHAAPSFNGSPENKVTVQTNGSTTTVTQSATSSNRALANWNDFSIPADEVVVFEQPNANSVILNRVLGSNPSEIFGRLSANGRVFLINPNGIVFGANSEVNVGGLVASTLTLKPGTQNGNDLIEFELTDTGGTIDSKGTINAKDIAFISTAIQNKGILNASGAGATVQLIAASQLTANTAGTDLVLNVIAGHDNAVINQLGEVLAQGGKIVLLARSQAGGQASVINMENIARASQIDIQGDVVRLTGDINLADAASDLKVTAQEIEQTGVLRFGGTTQLNADTVTLMNASNNFQGEVNANVGKQLNLQAEQDLAVSGTVSNATLQAKNIVLNGLQATGDVVLSASGSITQGAGASNALAVGGATQINNAALVHLNNSMNDFEGAVSLNGTGEVALVDQNSLRVQGQTNALDLRASGVTFSGLMAVADNLDVTADNINQTGAVVVDKNTTLVAGQLELLNAGNDFQGQVNLNVSGTATLRDVNDLLLKVRAAKADVQAGNTLTLGSVQVESGNFRADTIHLNALHVQDTAQLQASLITQTQAAETSGRLNLFANTVDLADAGNDFSGELRVNSATAHIVDSNDLSMTFAGDRLTAQAANLNVNELRATGDVVISADTASLVSTGDLSLQGQVGTLNVQARNLSQNGALMVRGTARLNADTVELRHQANDFQGEVALNVSGNAAVNDQNTLDISGRVKGAAQFAAHSLLQNNALITESDLLLQAFQIKLDHSANSLGGASANASNATSGTSVQLEGAEQAVLTSQGHLKVQGTVDSLTLAAKTVELGSLGSLQDLKVFANDVRQSAALQVEGQSNFTANNIELRNISNDFVGLVNIQARDSDLSRVALADSNSLFVQGQNMQFAAQVQVDLGLQADNVVLGNTIVQGASTLNVQGVLTQNQSVELNNATLTAGKITLNQLENRFNGPIHVQSDKLIELGSASDMNLNTLASTGALALNVQGDASVSGGHVGFADSVFNKHLNVTANRVSQTGRLMVHGDALFNAEGGFVNLQNANNVFAQTVSVNADQTNVSAQGDLRIQDLMTRGGSISAEGRLLLQGRIEQTGGTLNFTAKGIPHPLSSKEIARMLPTELDVFSAKEAVDPLNGLGRITLASAAIHQESGQMVTSADSMTRFNSTQNGSVVLAPVNQGGTNQINGQFEALAGQGYGQAFVYQSEQGASLFAVTNDVKLRVADSGVESDLVAIRSRGLATVGGGSRIRVRMPYNDTAAGTSRSYAGLTLSIPLGKLQQGSSNMVSFGEPSGVGQQAAGMGAIRVAVGELDRAGLGGFVTVLPFEGSDLLPGQVVYLAGPERRGTYAFFYDGARNLKRIPVVYNGSLLLSPQENAALTSAQGAVVLARQEQTRSVVRTENVAGKIINGVVAEVGPGRPATEGEGGAGKPDSCEAVGDGLSCIP